MSSIKKILTALILSTCLLSASNNAIAGVCNIKPYPISNVVSRTVQKGTGLGFLVKHFAQSQIKREISKTVKGDINLNLDLYSVGDLIAGKFKGANFSGKNITVENVKVSSIEAKTLCEFVHLNLKKNPVEPLSNIFVGYKTVITEKDINETLNAPVYKEMLSSLKLSNFINLAVLNPKVKIKNDKIYLSGKINFSGMPGFLSIPVNFGIKVISDKNKIRLVSLDILSNQFIDINFIDKYVSAVKPVIFDFKSISNSGENYNISDIDLKNNAINIDGTYFLSSKKGNKSKI